jgi:serine/threonine protein kinase
MLRPDGLVKVLDFGLAKLAEPESALKDSSTGAVMGTLLYISPEQARAQQPDARSDLYALGAVMYEMVTGRPPVQATTHRHRLRHREVPAAVTLCRRSPDFDQIIPKLPERTENCHPRRGSSAIQCAPGLSTSKLTSLESIATSPPSNSSRPCR